MIGSDLQGSQHIAGTDAVDADIVAGPLDGERGSKMAHGSLGSVVRRLGLGHVDNGAGHAADHDNAAGSLALHQVLGDAGGEEVCAVDVDTPELLHAVERVRDGVEVLREAGRGDEIVDFAVLGKHFRDGGVDGVGARNVGIVCGHIGHSASLAIHAQAHMRTYLCACLTAPVPDSPFETARQAVWPVSLLLPLRGVGQHVNRSKRDKTQQLLLHTVQVHNGQVRARGNQRLRHD